MLAIKWVFRSGFLYYFLLVGWMWIFFYDSVHTSNPILKSLDTLGVLISLVGVGVIHAINALGWKESEPARVEIVLKTKNEIDPELN